MRAVRWAVGLALLSLPPIKAALAKDRVPSANDVRAINDQLAALHGWLFKFTGAGNSYGLPLERHVGGHERQTRMVGSPT
jgi:hypothetical protein